ncbi:MAG: 50S ribosomal protein L29 [Fervidicoccaceae archaeon]
MKPDELRKLSTEDKRARLTEIRRELLKLRMQADLGTLSNPGKLRALRRTIARISTILREEERGRESSVGASREGRGSRV